MAVRKKKGKKCKGEEESEVACFDLEEEGHGALHQEEPAKKSKKAAAKKTKKAKKAAPKEGCSQEIRRQRNQPQRTEEGCEESRKKAAAPKPAAPALSAQPAPAPKPVAAPKPSGAAQAAGTRRSPLRPRPRWQHRLRLSAPATTGDPAPSPIEYRPFSPPSGDGNPDDNKT